VYNDSCQCYEKNKYRLLLLLLRGGMAQGVPSTSTICVLFCVPISVIITSNSSTSILINHQQRHFVVNHENLARNDREFCLRSICFRKSRVLLTCRKIVRHGLDGFTSSSREVVLRIFVSLKNTSSSAGFEPAVLGSNGSHSNHYTTEGDISVGFF
jgi:hypothetical protein